MEIDCGICARTLKDGDPAYATTTGSIEAEVDGFSASDMEPWLTVVCEECGQLISEVIYALQKAGAQCATDKHTAPPKEVTKF